MPALHANHRLPPPHLPRLLCGGPPPNNNIPFFLVAIHFVVAQYSPSNTCFFALLPTFVVLFWVPLVLVLNTVALLFFPFFFKCTRSSRGRYYPCNHDVLNSGGAFFSSRASPLPAPLSLCPEFAPAPLLHFFRQNTQHEVAAFLFLNAWHELCPTAPTMAAVRLFFSRFYRLLHPPRDSAACTKPSPFFFFSCWPWIVRA